jgi:2-succinyl-5-enolpyruvyl-6-hydroxy-3-cyclohexene-1-carboxylate synthase
VDIASVAAAHGLPYTRLEAMDGLAKVMAGEGMRIVEVRTDRTANAALHARMRDAAHEAVRRSLRG